MTLEVKVMISLLETSPRNEHRPRRRGRKAPTPPMRFGEWFDLINGDEVDNRTKSPIETVSFYPVENAKNHRTDKYELVQDRNTPVLRRTAPFYMLIDSQILDPKKDRIVLIFEFGLEPSVTKETRIRLELDYYKRTLNKNREKWDVIHYKTNGISLILDVQIGSSAQVGVWKCKVETYGNLTIKSVFYVKTPIYILFNPYSPEDSVYMNSEGKLNEYIQNDAGKIWKGEYRRFRGRQWVFGQFDELVLPVCCFILDQKSGLRGTERGNPVKVSRVISALVNSADEDGIVHGRWAKPYGDGTSPWDWSGSVKIFQEFAENNRPVKYGQCWVFSAVMVTFCRALGLPCRSVTNFVSAHDTNHSLTVDKFFGSNGDEMTPRDHPEIGWDSVWNFHVWNDVWMARPDLPAGYGGWQAIDATPQEASDNIYQCGPAPLEAIRRGEIGLGFDTSFIFAEVNADICYFLEDPKSDWGFTRTKLKTDHVGKKIVTNPVGYSNDGDDDDDFKDITWQYKNREGTIEERLSVFNAIRGIDRAMKYYDYPADDETRDVVFDMEELEVVNYGDPYKAKVHIQNRSKEIRTLNCIISSSSVFYTGVKAATIKKAQGDFVLRPGERSSLVLSIDPEDYMDRLVDYCMMKIYSLIRVKETNQTWSDEDDFLLQKPKLKIEVMGQLKKGRLGRFRIYFRNNLNVPLTKCKITLECAGAFREVRESVRNIGPKEVFTHTVLGVPKKAGSGTLVATFSAEEMVDVYGSTKIDVAAY